MKIGTAAHCLVLDGEKAFDGAYVRQPDNIKLTTKEGKEWKASVGRKTVLNSGGKDDPWGSVQGMAESLRRLEWYSGTDAEYIKRNEVSIYWDWMGVRCKARLDSVLVDEGIVLDLKTTDTVDAELFTKKVVGLGYDFQAAYYAKAAEVAYGKPFQIHLRRCRAQGSIYSGSFRGHTRYDGRRHVQVREGPEDLRRVREVWRVAQS